MRRNTGRNFWVWQLAFLLLGLSCSCLTQLGAAAARTTTTTTTPTRTTTTAAKRRDKTPACPNARLCNLATQSAFNTLTTRVDDVFARLYSVFNYVEGIVTIGGSSSSSMDACQITSEDPQFTNVCGLVLQQDASPLYAYLDSTCPAGYLAAIERDCTATAYDALGERIGFRALLKSGSSGGVSYCHADTQGMAAGTQVHLEMTVRCIDAPLVPE